MEYKKVKSRQKGYGKEIEVDKDFVQPYFDNKKRHKNYLKCLDEYFHVSFHAEGYFKKPGMAQYPTMGQMDIPNPYFSRLIDTRRPSESDIILSYRRDRYMPVTKDPIYKVINSLKKILRSADWKIDFSKCEVPKSLPDEERLQLYTEEFFPYDDSVENWAYNKAMRWMLTDPNSLCVVVPLSFEPEDNEFLKPVARIIPCKDVYDYRENELAVWLSPDVSPYNGADGKMREGKIIGIMTTTCYYEAIQTGQKEFDLVEHPHNIGELPAFLMGGENKSPNLVAPFYQSFLNPMLPSLDQAAAENSDLEAACVQHMYPEKWEIQSEMCSACDGSGFVPGQGQQVVCTAPGCVGGRMQPPPSPYRVHVINFNRGLDSGMADKIPTPPGGYYEKPVEIIKFMIDKVDRGLYNALAAVNMEFLAKTPTVQSGVAKAMDRDETNNFIYGCAQWLVENIIEQVYYFVNEWRYITAVPNKEDRMKMLPRVDTPENFDFLYEASLVDDAIKLAASDLSPNVKEQAEMDFIHKKWQEVPELKNKLAALQSLDPLPGLGYQELQSLLQANVFPKIDFVLHYNLKTFVDQLTEKDPGFFDLDKVQQRELVYELAQAKMDGMQQEQEENDAKKAEVQRQKDEQAIKLAQAQAKAPIPPMAQPNTVPERIDAKNTQRKPGKRDRDDMALS
jgi:hypothetical protein